MKSIVVILSLMGCDDAAKNCEQIEATNVVFASQDACLRASEDFFQAHADASYPMVLAKCDIKTPTEVASRPTIDIENEDLSIHNDEIVPVEFTQAELEEKGWFRVTLGNAGNAVKKPIVGAANGIANGTTSAATWVGKRAKSAVDLVNPF